MAISFHTTYSSACTQPIDRDKRPIDHQLSTQIHQAALSAQIAKTGQTFMLHLHYEFYVVGIAISGTQEIWRLS